MPSLKGKIFLLRKVYYTDSGHYPWQLILKTLFLSITVAIGIKILKTHISPKKRYAPLLFEIKERG